MPTDGGSLTGLMTIAALPDQAECVHPARVSD